MHQLTIAFSGSDLAELKNLKQQISKKHPEIKVQKANLETLPGAIDTLSVLGVTISVMADDIPQVVSTWLYDLLKKGSPEAKIALHINGVRVSSPQQVETIVKKQVSAKQAGGKKPGEKKISPKQPDEKAAGEKPGQPKKGYTKL